MIFPGVSHYVSTNLKKIPINFHEQYLPVLKIDHFVLSFHKV